MKHAQFVDKKLKRISFKDKRAYLCNDVSKKKGANELYVPGATTILEVVPKGQHFYNYLKNRGKEADTIMMEAMEKGSRVHAATEEYDLNGKFKIIPDLYTIEEIEMIHKYKEFADRYMRKIIAIEWGKGCHKLGFGGTLDRVCEFKGKYYLLDVKTGNIYPYYWRQLAAYKMLWEFFNPDKKIENYGIIHLNAQTRTEKDWQGKGWQVLWNEEKHSYWWDLFLNAKKEFHLLTPNFTPDNRIFNLVIKQPKIAKEKKDKKKKPSQQKLF